MLIWVFYQLKDEQSKNNKKPETFYYSKKIIWIIWTKMMLQNNNKTCKNWKTKSISVTVLERSDSIVQQSFNSAKLFHPTAVVVPGYLSEKSIDLRRQEHSTLRCSSLHVACFVHWLHYIWVARGPKRSVTSWKKPRAETTENVRKSRSDGVMQLPDAFI